MFCCSIFLLAKSASAQCPGSGQGPYPDPDSCAWYSTNTHETIPGTSCYVTVDYCFRDCDDTVQVWIYEVDPDSSIACDSLTAEQIIDGAHLIAQQQALTLLGAGAVAPCGTGTQWTVEMTFIPSCWQVVSARLTGGGMRLTTCEDAYGCYCTEACNVCYDLTTQQINYLTCQYLPGGCTCTAGFFPGIPFNLVNPGCYSINCAAQGGEVIEHSLGVSSPVSIDTTLHLFPNPASEQLTVSSAQTGKAVEILDILGREMKRGIIPTNGPLQFDVSTLPDGTYYISEGQTELKFVKN